MEKEVRMSAASTSSSTKTSPWMKLGSFTGNVLGSLASAGPSCDPTQWHSPIPFSQNQAPSCSRWGTMRNANSENRNVWITKRSWIIFIETTIPPACKSSTSGIGHMGPMPLQFSRMKVLQYGCLFEVPILVRKPSPSEDSKEINRCRILCKDFWRDAFLLIDNCTTEIGERKISTWSSRHHRFRDQVQKLEVLDDYHDDGKEDYVYIPDPKFSEYPVEHWRSSEIKTNATYSSIVIYPNNKVITLSTYIRRIEK